jgi:hypothetical protein
LKICLSRKEKSLETGCVKDSQGMEAEGDLAVEGIPEAEADRVAVVPEEDNNIIIQMR